MKKSELTDAFEVLGPTDNEKKQVYERVCEIKVRRRPNLRPLGILAAGLALLCITAIPLIGTWFQPEAGDPANPENPGIIAPGTSEPGVSPKPINTGDRNQFSLRGEESIPLAGIESIKVFGLHQAMTVTFTDAEEMTIRHYDYEDIQPLAWIKDGKSIKANIAVHQFEESGRPEGEPRVEIEIPRSYRGDVNLCNVAGNLTVTGETELGTIDLGSVSGDIIVSGLKAEYANLGTVSGNIMVSGEFGNMTAGSVSGTVIINGEKQQSGFSGLRNWNNWDFDFGNYEWPWEAEDWEWPDFDFDWPWDDNDFEWPDYSNFEWPDLDAIHEQARKDAYDHLEKELRINWSDIEELEGWTFDLSVVNWDAMEWKDDESFGFASLGTVTDVRKDGRISVSHLHKDNVFTKWGKDTLSITPEEQEIKVGDIVLVLFKTGDYFLIVPNQVLIAQPK
ncbi:MAG: DUF4097 domain-containing protein [Oscillospiraceae bacterium]|nr:DUF4097 domain-containing protein [Oscillospiraceae bacterium]